MVHGSACDRHPPGDPLSHHLNGPSNAGITRRESNELVATAPPAYGRCCGPESVEALSTSAQWFRPGAVPFGREHHGRHGHAVIGVLTVESWVQLALVALAAAGVRFVRVQPVNATWLVEVGLSLVVAPILALGIPPPSIPAAVFGRLAVRAMAIPAVRLARRLNPWRQTRR